MIWKCEHLGSAHGWEIVHVHTLQHQDRLVGRNGRSSWSGPADVTALSFTTRALYAGDSLGRVWLWNPPGTELVLPDSVNNGLCMSCGSKFGLMECESERLERKRAQR